MKTLFTVQIIDTLSKIASSTKSKKLDISSDAVTNALFNKFLQLGNQLYGRPFMTKLSSSGIRTYNDFTMMLSSDAFINDLSDDAIGRKVLSQIKYPSADIIKKKMTDCYNKYKDHILCDESDIDDAEHTFAIRTKLGNGPVVFIKGINDDAGRHEVRRWYAWQYKINYFDVRECSYEHWSSNPETQIATNN